MKLVMLALLLAARPAAADCGCATEVVGTSPLVIEATCTGKTLPKTALVDDSGARQILHVVATHHGYSRSVQFVLEPVGAGTLEIDDGFGITRTRIEPEKASKWTADPSLGEQHEIELGCGPAQSVKVVTGATSKVAFVELVDDKRTQTGFVRVTGGELSLGHHMCGGPFVLAKGHHYSAAITIGTATNTVAFTFAPSR